MLRCMVVLSLIFVTSCSTTGYDPRYRFNNVQAVNLTGASITNVEIVVFDTEKTIVCDDVNANAMCAERFPSRPYPKQGIRLSWTDSTGTERTETMNPHIATFFNSAFPLRVVMEVSADGSVKAFYEQDEPGRSVYF